MKEMSFSMVYGVKAVLPTKIGVEIARVFAYTPEENAVTRVEELDLVEEKRMQAFYKMERYWT